VWTKPKRLAERGDEMSIAKTSETGDLGSEFEGLTPKQIKEKLIETFYKAYGRYHNVTGKMWVEIYHNGDPTDTRKGMVIWRKGTYEQDELLEDEILEREVAIPRFISLMGRGYTRLFEAIGQSEMDTHNKLRLAKQSTAEREGWIGVYYKGKSFFRLNEFSRGEFYIERGYDGAVHETSKESEGGAKYELEIALADGYRKVGEGEEEVDFVNPLEAFGINLTDTIEAQEEQSKPKDGELPDSFFDMMR